ncbi:MAG: relaxase/mobilization nuclease domain-containing protein [Solirubrobacteraceae bacterium]
MPNITRGGSTGRVLGYLVGKGRSGEHVNPHVVAGRAWAVFEKGARTLSNRAGDVRDLAAFIDGPMNEALADGRLARPPTRAAKEQEGEKAVERAVHVWHCSLALHPEEPAVGDERWSAIATRYMQLMRLEPADGGPACRWVAIHHGPAKGGNDHIHIVANVVGEDGRRWGEHND